jgi:hypothetical protein
MLPVSCQGFSPERTRFQYIDSLQWTSSQATTARDHLEDAADVGRW